AAHHATTSTVSSMVYDLGAHPLCQERCRRERRAPGPQPTMGDPAPRTGVDRARRETLRLPPSVPGLARPPGQATAALGVHIPAGRLTAVMPLYSHYMPEYWSRPTLFDPERFSAERREDKSHRFAWEPFGGGVHKCLGMIFAGLETK